MRQVNIHGFLIIWLLISCLNGNLIYGQGHYYFQYHPFDSSGILTERIIVPLDTTIFDPLSSSRLKKDSSSLEFFFYVSELFANDSRLVMKGLLYSPSTTVGVDLYYARAKAIMRKLLRLGIDGERIDFQYRHRTREGVKNEELLSNDKRLEVLIYKLPTDW